MSDAGPWLDRWRLDVDGPTIRTANALLLPVRRDTAELMLKLALTEDERLGFDLLEWWGGAGAVPVLERDGPALLMPRASGSRDLAQMARQGQDDLAMGLLCAVANRLHAHRAPPPAHLVPLDQWFRELPAAVAAHGGILQDSLQQMQELLPDQQQVVPLHGDLHHANVLDFNGEWLAIDAKALIGERVFDFAVMFGNPDLDDPAQPVALLPGVLDRRLAVVCREAGLDRERLLRWLLAWSGLSAAWFLGDDPVDRPRLAVDLHIAEWAAVRLAG
ncbi:aminoglycoside phosphotransferase family protein [Paracoccus sulfuroxidans]|uniref:Streptomycin 6-kinase n=1 Tax=Paracoccus sulfuroxidans TaxID=384678 RepID=A0A562NS00_9RHOB|nr:aminoglycoside phosphotransferase family protein [Paracoccus sulfuroxidans]TWI34978.1 streptomycin 6-kinase [Paracoccus sulfuroxidans]